MALNCCTLGSTVATFITLQLCSTYGIIYCITHRKFNKILAKKEEGYYKSGNKSPIKFRVILIFNFINKTLPIQVYKNCSMFFFYIFMCFDILFFIKKSTKGINEKKNGLKYRFIKRLLSSFFSMLAASQNTF